MPPPYCYEHPRPSVTVDVVVFSVDQGTLRVVLVRRKKDPFEGRWAIPGGFLDIDEPPDEGARRELREETGLEVPWPLDPLGFFAAPDRDPRGRTISLAYATVVRPPAPEPAGGDDASEASWRELDKVRNLAFDHDLILKTATAWLRRSLRSRAIGLAMLPEEFTAAEANTLFRAVFGEEASATSWRNQLVKSGHLRSSDTTPKRYLASGFHPGVWSSWEAE